ncbi:MAG: phosphatidylinositol-specific phospholipase C1-like protein [Aquihabitans sp.]
MTSHDVPTRRILATATVIAGLVLAACGGSDGGPEGRPVTPESTTTTTEAPIRPDDDLRLNEIQVLGTHNSFHVAPDPAELALLAAMDQAAADERGYTHQSLGVQLGRQQIRQIELDIFVDKTGGTYATPDLRTRAGLDPYIEEMPEMAEPGSKVMHEQDVDYRTVCPTVVSCLAEVREWSDANPGHVPVAIQIQFKDGPLIFPVEDQVKPERWTGPNMDLLDAEILSVFDRDQVITPDDVRGSRMTLEGAILEDGWPTLGESRGKVMFVIGNGEPYRTLYLDRYENLVGRVMFTNAEPGQSDASFMNVDNPVGNEERIRELVELGYIVRTRADSPNEEGRTGDTTRREAALASGAQWVGTDYPAPDSAKEQYGTDYEVVLPGGFPARCNPVTAPATCKDVAVEP